MSIHSTIRASRRFRSQQVYRQYLEPPKKHLTLSVVLYPADIPPAGAIMNQLQGSNLGADLFNGTLT